MNVGVRRWQTRLPAVVETLGLIRSGLRRWLVTLDWPDDAALDVLLAVNEAVTNAVEHAFLAGAPLEPAAWPDVNMSGRVVEVSAEVEQHDGHRRIRIRVHDNGRWLPRPSGEEDLNQRHGMPMMFALMEQVTIHHGGIERVSLGPDAPAVHAPAADAPAADTTAGEGSVSTGTVVTMLSPPVPAPAR